MDGCDLIRAAAETTNLVVDGYLGDLADADLVVRPVPGANHMAWQLGHLISSARQMVEAVVPGSMPALPAGFEERYTAKTAALDDLAAFDTKDTYARLLNAQRTAVLAVLDRLNAADLDRPVPPGPMEIFKTVGGVLHAACVLHPLMHSGQWVAVRRLKGLKPLF
ncbi:MAG: DinB family protein [Pirellulales bacterium]